MEMRQGKATHTVPARDPFSCPIPDAIANMTDDAIPPIRNTIPAALSGGSGNP